MIILLFGTFILLDIGVFFLFNKDVIAPPFIFCAMYTVSIAFALTEYKNWQLSDYSIKSFWIYLGGAIIFCFIGYLISKLCDFLCVNNNVSRKLKIFLIIKISFCSLDAT